MILEGEAKGIHIIPSHGYCECERMGTDTMMRPIEMLIHSLTFVASLLCREGRSTIEVRRKPNGDLF